MRILGVGSFFCGLVANCGAVVGLAGLAGKRRASVSRQPRQLCHQSLFTIYCSLPHICAERLGVVGSGSIGTTLYCAVGPLGSPVSCLRCSSVTCFCGFF